MSTVRWAPKNAKTHEASLSENMAQELYERLAADAFMTRGRPTASIHAKQKLHPVLAVIHSLGSDMLAPAVHATGLLARPISEDIGNRLIDTAIDWRNNSDNFMVDQSLGTQLAAAGLGFVTPDATDLVKLGRVAKTVDNITDAIPPKVGPRGPRNIPVNAASPAPSGLVPPVVSVKPVEGAKTTPLWSLGAYEEYVPPPRPVAGPLRYSPVELELSDTVQRPIGKPLDINEMLGSDQIVANNFLTPIEQRMAQRLASRAQPRPGTELVLSPRGELVHVPVRPAYSPRLELTYHPPLELPFGSSEYKAASRDAITQAIEARDRANLIQNRMNKAGRIFAEGEATHQAAVLANARTAATAKHKAARRTIDKANARLAAYQKTASAQAHEYVAKFRADQLAKELEAKAQPEVDAIFRAEDEARLAKLNEYADRVNRAEEAYRAGRASEYRKLFGPGHDVAFGPRRAAEAKAARAAKAEAKAAKAEAKAAKAEAEAAELPRSFWQKKRGKALKWGGAGWTAVGGTAAATQWFTPAARVYQQRLDDAEAKKLSAEVDYLKQPWNGQYRDAYTKASAELKQAKDMSYFWSNVGQGLLKVPMGPIGYANYANQLGDHRRDRAAVSELQKEVDQARGAFVGNAMKDLAARLERATQTATNATTGRPHLASLTTPTTVDRYRTQVFRDFAKQYSDIDSDLLGELSAAFEEAYKVPLSSYLER